MRKLSVELAVGLVLGVLVIGAGCSAPSSDENTNVSFDDVRGGKRCGNGTCNTNESCSTCPQDCGACSTGGGDSGTSVDSATGVDSATTDSGTTDGASAKPVVGPQASITCPAGSVSVAPGASTIQNAVSANPAGTSFCLAAGATYLLTSPIVPKAGDTFTGEYGATIDGTNAVSTYDIGGSAIFRAWNDGPIDNVTVRNLFLKNHPYQVIGNWGSKAWTIEHNDISGGNWGVNHDNDTHITNNYIHDNRCAGITAYQKSGAVIEANEIAFNDPDGSCWASDAGGGSKWNECSNLTLRGNYVHDNVGTGLWLDGCDWDASSVSIIENNTVENNSKGHAIENEVGGAVIIRNNSISIPSTGATGIQIAISHNGQVYGNTIMHGGQWPALGLFYTPRPDVAGSDLANNAVHDNKVTLQGAAVLAASISCYNVADCSPWFTSKGNSFQGDAYVVPDLNGTYFHLGEQSRTWTEWQAAGFDTTGSLTQ